MIFESLASKRPQEAALFLRPYLVSVLGLPVAKPHLWSSLVCKDYIIPHIVTLFLHTDSYIYIFPNRRLTGCIPFRLKIVSEVFCNRQISRRIKKHLWLSNRSWARDVHSFGILHSWGALAGKSCSAQASSIWLIAGAFRRTQSK